jgi:DNA polymerase
MDLYTVDFETYWSQDYTLQKMTTEDYVSDPRFHIIGVSVKKNNETPVWIHGKFKDIIKGMFYTGCFSGAWLCHNSYFDCLIAAIHMKFVPPFIFDTRLMAQAVLRPYMRSVSLASCLKHLKLGLDKGDTVLLMKGRTYDSLSKRELAEYGKYCCNDTEAEFRLFKHLLPTYPREELEIIDTTLRMYLQPQLIADSELLAEILAEVRAKKAQLLASLPAGLQKADLMSNEKFAEALRGQGIVPPMKISPSDPNKMTYAFAKSDTAWKELEEEYDDDPQVSALLAARVGLKSTLEESRTQRLLDISIRHPVLRVPILYHAAHTGRDGGMERINMQNPPRIDKSRLRFAFRAPPKHLVMALDLAQIEARVTAWLAGQNDLLTLFRNRQDPYAKFASIAYRCDVKKGRSKEDDKKRFVGKTCVLGLGFGMGAPKLRATLRKDGVILPLGEDEMLVNTYRRTYHHIPRLWRTLDATIPLMVMPNAHRQFGPVTFAKNCVILPNGMQIVYHGLQQLDGNNKMEYTGWAYSFGGEWRTLWGGKVTENVVQALARILVMKYMLQIKREYGMIPVLRVHDELVYIVQEHQAEELALACSQIMRVPPKWAPDLPVEVEANFGPTYGDCK